MRCSKCESDNTYVQLTNEVEFKKKRKGLIYWLLIGWWLEIILWVFFTIPRLLIALFVPKKKKVKNTQKKYFVCNNCGHTAPIK